MPIRITGMNSGLDTESIIAELVKAERTKVETTKKKQTAFEWKQEAWKELNTKIGKLFNSLNSMRFSGDWSRKTTDVSNSSVASVVTSGNAMNVTQKLKVEKLATTAYMTGGVVKTQGGQTAYGGTKLSDLGLTVDTAIELNGKKIELNGDMSIADLTSRFQQEGLEASFDAVNGRFHIASKTVGKQGDFSIGAVSGDAVSGVALRALGLQTGDPTHDSIWAKKVDGENAKIWLNGVSYESTTGNVFSINGLTITAKEASDQEVALTTRRDTEGVYDKVKKFLQEYNELIKEMDSLYNAASSKGYEPLTDEEKEAMTEKEIEKWEEKIKGSILRRDSNLDTISTAMKEVMLKGATVNGKQMYLANFGIETLGYYEAEENERNVYQILGDSDFTDPSSRLGDTSNILKEKIEEDPDMVIDFFSQLTMNLYKKLDEQSRSIKDIRSFGKFYDDKLMETEYKEYTSKIEKQEAKLTALEDKWYKKFAAMETALAKMQSNQNALSSLLGG